MPRRSKFEGVTATDVLPYMQSLNRQPFMEIMALFLACRPDPESLLAFAAQHPDRWANACSIFAKLSGYSEKVEHHHEHEHMHMHVHKLSDAQLHAALEQARTHPNDPALEAQLEGVRNDTALLLQFQERPSTNPAQEHRKRSKLVSKLPPKKGSKK